MSVLPPGLEDDSASPWGLPLSVLEPGKVITDPVHGDIHLNKLEVAVIDSRPFQRLRRIRQLGNTHLVYPGAVHTRFSHCLGALRVAQRLLKVVWNQRHELHGVEDDLFAEWHQPREGRTAEERHRRAKGLAEREWERAKVLARLGALLHNLCHVPAGHTVEDDLTILEPHDKNVERFAEMWGQLCDDVPLRLAQLKIDADDRAAVDSALLSPESELHKQLKPLVISKGDDTLVLQDMEYPFCADLVGNTICADLLDYLDRDHLFTGLPESLGRRFISAFFVTPSDRGPFSKRLALNILRGGHERTDVVSELLKALRYRYELSERALVHPAKLAADAMLGESIERWEWALWSAAARCGGVFEDELSRARQRIDEVPYQRAKLERGEGKARKSEREWKRTKAGKLEREVRNEMEREFRRLGDEGLLDFLASLPERPHGDLPLRFLKQSADLAADLRDRRLFRTAERVGAGDVSPKDISEQYGSPAKRARLEAEAQVFAGLGSAPKVVLWIPPPDMRLKLANVLVRQKSGIAPFVNYERSRSRRGSDIYDAHSRLWAAYVFVHRDVSDLEEKAVSAFLGRTMGIRWERHRELGRNPHEWPLRLAIAEEFGLGFKTRLDEFIEAHSGEVAKVREQAFAEVSARKPVTFSSLRQSAAREIRPPEESSQGAR